MQLTYKGKKLCLKKTLGEQDVKNKGVFQFTQINEDERKHTAFISRIMKGAELLAKRDFEEKYLNATDHRVEAIDLPEDEKAVFLAALILQELGRWNMKRKDYDKALLFLENAETEFRQCREELINSIDNYGVLNLDITWCYLQLHNSQYHAKARERLENAEKCFKMAFGENQERLKELKDKSGRHRILSLRLLVLWGVWFFHSQNLKQSWNDFCKAEEQLDQLSVDDLSVSILVNEGYETREARLALRATDGNIEEAKSYIAEKRQEKIAAERRRERLRGLVDRDHSEQASPERNGTSDQINQEPPVNTNPTPVVGSSLPPPAGETSSLPAAETSSSPAGETSSSITTPAASAPTGAQSNAEEDKLLGEILTYLPNDIDDYIDLSLEDEEAIVREYKAKLNACLRERHTS
ncbi:NEDD8 ultimate buster 1-like isoform X2 [Pristis pectinata]|nr:NEDD8 ultimate buster 1-like isoform X2 [Pristis pectinata]